MRILAVVAENELQGIECGAITAHRFQKDTWVLFVDFVKAFGTVPREMLFKVLARLGFPPKIANLVRLFHENVTRKWI
jgi:hypothetical protein